MLKSMGGLYPHRARDLIVSGTVLVAHALVACNGDSIDLTGPCCDAEAAANFNFQLDATNRVQFRLIGVNGRMLVTGASAGEQFIVRGERRVESSSQADAEARLNDLQVEITESANEIVIRTVQPTNTGGRNFIVDYELLVPDRLVANITNVNGEITVDDFDSGAFVTNVNGLVIVRDIEGERNHRSRHPGGYRRAAIGHAGERDDHGFEPGGSESGEFTNIAHRHAR
jgi:hypothetical protein